MTKQELLGALSEARSRLEAALAGLDEARLVAPGAGGDDWSIKDILSHLTAWEAEIVTGLARIRRGQTPGKTDYSAAEIAAQNAAWHAENKDRPLDRVLADFHGVRKQLLRQLEAYPDKDLSAPRKGLEAQTIAAWVRDWIVEHEHEHAEHLTAWRRQAGA